MTKSLALLLVVSAAATAAARTQDLNDNRSRPAVRLSAFLVGDNETPVVSTPARGTFFARIDDASETIEYRLTFDDLQAPVTQAHIHVGQPNVAGGIVVWLCGTMTNPGPMGTQQCPQSGTITGTIVPGDIQNVPAQGFAVNEFDELVAAIRKGFAYANVHTAQSPSGEIRGQIDDGHRH